MEKRQDTRLRINGLNAALVEGHKGTSLVATQDYIEAMRESHSSLDKREALYSIGDLSPFLIEESPEKEAEIELMKRTHAYLIDSTKSMKAYQTRGKQ